MNDEHENSFDHVPQRRRASDSQFSDAEMTWLTGVSLAAFVAVMLFIGVIWWAVKS